MASPEENGVLKADIELSRLNSPSNNDDIFTHLAVYRRQFSADNDLDDPDVDPDHILPPLADWNSWWSAAFHTVGTATVAAGVLALPTAMAYLGWWGGTIVLVQSWVITLFTLCQMVQMHEMVSGERNDTYLPEDARALASLATATHRANWEQRRVHDHRRPNFLAVLPAASL